MMTAQEEFLELVVTNSKLLSDDSIKTLTAILRLCLYKDCREHALSETRQALADIKNGNTNSFDSVAEMREQLLADKSHIEEVAQEFGINL